MKRPQHIEVSSSTVKMSAKQTVVLLHGAWHSTSCFDRLCPLLQASGFPTCAVQLPSAEGGRQMNGFHLDVEEIRAKVNCLIEDGKEVILFMHSYSGAPGSEAVKDLTLRQRQSRGLKGGVTHLIYCAAIIAAQGEPIISDHEKFASSVVLSDDKVTCFPTEAKERFYGDLDSTEADEYVSRLRWQNVGVFNSIATYSAFKDVESTYIYCEKDQAFPVGFQRYVVKMLGETHFQTVSLPSSHSPFLSMPERVVGIVEAVSEAPSQIERPGQWKSA